MDVLSNIRVVPHFQSNNDLARRIREELAECIGDTTYKGNKLPPEIIIFRPSGRPGDEFEEAVSPHIGKSSSPVYLLVAFSGQAKDISTLVPYSLKDRVKITEAIFIQSGHLVPAGSDNYKQNKKAFESVSAVLCTDYGPRNINRQGRTHADSEQRTVLKICQSVWSSIRGLMDRSGSASTLSKHEKTDDNYVVVSLEGDNVKMLGLAFRIIAEFQEGIPHRDVCTLMKLQKKEEEDLMTTVEEVKTVFKINTKGGQRYIKLAESFREELSRIEGSDEYKDALRKFTRKSQMTDQISKQQLKALQKQDNLDLDILQGIDDHFKLNGRLWEILSKTCEVLAVSPEGITNMDQDEENSTSVDERTDERVQKDEEKAEASEAQPDLMDFSESKDEVKGTVISLEDVSIFLGTHKTHPKALDAELISLIEQEFKIHDRLLKELEDMCESHGKVCQATTGNPTPVNCDSFLDIMGKPTTSLDKALEEAIVSKFGISALDVSDGLKRICESIKNRSEAHV